MEITNYRCIRCSSNLYVTNPLLSKESEHCYKSSSVENLDSARKPQNWFKLIAYNSEYAFISYLNALILIRYRSDIPKITVNECNINSIFNITP